MTYIFLSDCGTFPLVKKAEKQVIKYATTKSIQTEVSVRYVCKHGYYYTLDNPTVSCTEKGLDNKIGNCVKGSFFWLFIVRFNWF